VPNSIGGHSTELRVETAPKPLGPSQAKSVEAVWNFLVESGLIQWNSIDVVHGVTMEHALEEIKTLKPIY
jgi:hypothetical protein